MQIIHILNSDGDGIMAGVEEVDKVWDSTQVDKKNDSTQVDKAMASTVENFDGTVDDMEEHNSGNDKLN